MHLTHKSRDNERADTIGDLTPQDEPNGEGMSSSFIVSELLLRVYRVIGRYRSEWRSTGPMVI